MLVRSGFYLLILILTALLTGCEKELSTTPGEIIPDKNALIIDSKPAGAKIFINGKNTGQLTPDTIFWAQPGNLLVTLKKELFKDSSLTVKVIEKDTAEIFFDFTANKTMQGKLYVDSNPRGAQVFLNDSALNKVTPFTIEGLIPGYYNVRYRMPGYWDDVKIAPVKSVVTTYIDQQLTDTLTWINYTMDRTDIPSNYLSSVAIEKGYIKWLGTLDAGLIRFDDQTWTVYNTSNSIIPDNNINSVGVDYFGNLWVCTNAGVVRKKGDEWTLFTAENSGLPDNKVLSVSFDGSKTCFGTLNSGFTIFDGANWTTYNKDNSILPSNMVNAVLYHDVNLWICTNNGIVRIQDTLWRVTNTSNSGVSGGGGVSGGQPRPTGFPNNNAKCIAIDRLGKPWVGFGYQGQVPGGTSVLRIANIWRTFQQKPGPEVYTIAVDMNNIKWLGSSENGLSKLEGETWTHYNMANSAIRSDRIFGVIIDGNGHKYMASFGAGLIKYKGN